MNLPILKVPGNRREQYTVAFRGVRYGEGARDGELEDSRNLTSERFPCLSPRGGRSTEGSYVDATAVYYKNGQFVVNGTELLYNGEVIANVTDGKKQFATVNTKVVVLPDQIMFDTATGEVRKLGAEYISEANMAEFVGTNTIALHQGKYYTRVVSTGNIGGTGTNDDNKPTLKRQDTFYKYTSVSVNSETGELTLDGGGSTIIAKVYSESNLHIDKQYVGVGTIFTKATDVSSGKVLVDLDPTKQWAVITKQYKYQRPGISGPTADGGYVSSSTGEPYFGFDYEVREVGGESYDAFAGFEELGFRVGDTVEISGCTMYPEHNKSCTIRGFGTYTTSDGTELPTLVFDPETFSGTGVEAGAVTIRRKVPNLSVICESSNRLWGAEGNTIYASALGDPTNFFTYDGLDTDSYAVAVASEGNFTGCIGYGSAVLFFKEDRLYKILGAYPSQYTMYDYTVPGVKNGSEKSLRNLNEVIYYHGREGVYRYSGGAPELISENFGLRRFQNACAGAEGGRYYISMQDRDSLEWGMWVYDIQRGIWLQEDGMQAVDFACDGGKLYCAAGDGRVLVLNPDSSGETVEWSATLARMDETVHDSKCYSRLTLRAEIPEGAWLQVEISCDGGPFQLVYTDHDTKARVRDIPILPNGCDSFRVRLSGEGPVIIRSMVREYRLSNAVR